MTLGQMCEVNIVKTLSTCIMYIHVHVNYLLLKILAHEFCRCCGWYDFQKDYCL
jgi:hypothetical protein